MEPAGAEGVPPNLVGGRRPDPHQALIKKSGVAGLLPEDARLYDGRAFFDAVTKNPEDKKSLTMFSADIDS